MHRILWASVLIVFLAAACTGSPGTAGPTSASAAPTASAMATPSPTSLPTSEATPAPTPAPTVPATCPPGPLTAAAFLESHSSCYLTTDVSVVGWWDSARTTDTIHSNLDHVIRGSMPFNGEGAAAEDILFVDEIAAVPHGGWPGGAHWATVTGRRSPTTDRACHFDVAPDVSPDPIRHCPSYLVASKVVESEPPAEAVGQCDTIPSGEAGSWLAVEVFTAYAPACFGSRDMTVRGWFDIRYVITGWEESWGIAPGWLWNPIGPWTVVAPGSNPETDEALTVYVDPDRHLDVSRTNRWVLLTGHYADAKAKTCHVEYAGGYDEARDGARISDAYARRVCEVHFVVTGIRATSP